ncbi:MAG: GNAT family N-acetyltransferase [Clostridiales bacterium]|nr:GNAT family N-acetyltransferase [Clostridiales bacterium]
MNTGAFEKNISRKGNGDGVDFVKELESNELKRVYREHIREDFPRDERRPLFSMERMQKEGRYDCYGYYREDCLLAYACFILTRNGAYALLDYFAVVSELRGQGIGSAFLRDLRGNVSANCGVFLEAENPNAAKTDEEKRLRERRIRFYLANGAEQTGTGCHLFGVDYNILFVPTGAADRAAETEFLHRAAEELYREVYGRAYGRLCKPYETGGGPGEG